MIIFITFYAPDSVMMLIMTKISPWNFNGLDKLAILDALLCITSFSNILACPINGHQD